jgi:hypothetical protein
LASYYIGSHGSEAGTCSALQFRFPSVFAVFRVRQEPKQEHLASVVMYRANQPEGIAAYVKHHDRVTTGYAHLIRRPKALAQVGKMPELSPAHDSSPDSQARCGLRVTDGKSSQSAFFNNPHAYNLCSITGFVKCD